MTTGIPTDELDVLLTREGLEALLDLEPQEQRALADDLAEDLTAHLTKTLADRRAVELGHHVDLARALEFASFCREFVKHSKGQWCGQPLELAEWQWATVILPLFGWVHRDTGYRRFRVCYLEIPKKNGKTLLAAAIALFLLVADGEPGPEVYCCASGIQQARLAYQEVERTVRRSDSLSTRLRPYKAVYRIVDEGNFGFLEAVSGEAGLQEGANIHGLVFDELHVQKTRRLWDAIEGGGMARRQPMLVAITTAGDEKSTVCRQQHDYSRSILDDLNDDHTHLGIIYGADPGDDWDDVETWKKANPGLGISILLEDLEGLAKKARRSRGARVNFKRRHLNIWGDSATRWVDLAAWDACEDAAYLDVYEPKAQAAVGGLDLASTTDLVGYVRVFDLPDGRIGVRARGWTTDRAADERETENKQRYGDWLEEGYLETAGASAVSGDVIKAAVIADFEAGRLSQLGLDPWGLGQYLANDLDENEGIPCCLVRQGFHTLSAPMKRLEELILEGDIAHDGHPALRWCMSNLTVRTDPAGNLKPDRERSPEKIDLAVALIIALVRYLERDENGPSVYEERGILLF